MCADSAPPSTQLKIVMAGKKVKKKLLLQYVINAFVKITRKKQYEDEKTWQACLKRRNFSQVLHRPSLKQNYDHDFDADSLQICQTAIERLSFGASLSVRQVHNKSCLNHNVDSTSIEHQFCQTAQHQDSFLIRVGLYGCSTLFDWLLIC